MELLQQPNAWTCGVTALAMCCDTTVERVLELIGHDGSKVVDPTADSIFWRLAGIVPSELALAAYKLGYALVEILAMPQYVNGEAISPWLTPLALIETFEPNTRLLITYKRDSGVCHCVAMVAGHCHYHDPLISEPVHWNEIPPVVAVAAVFPLKRAPMLT